MTPQPTIILQGATLPDLFEMMKQAAREALAETMASEAQQPEPIELPDEVPAAMAAKFCGYATAKSLVQYHFKELTPIRHNGRRLFYAKAEVVKLKKIIFNQR